MSSFLRDKEKMEDFYKLSREDFLHSYSYLTEDEYDETLKIFNKLKEEIKEYDIEKEKLDKKWKKIQNDIIPGLDYFVYNDLVMRARYETKQSNLDIEMLNAFKHNNPLDVKHWIHKGADKQKLYDYVHNNKNDSLTIIQGWLLEDLHNIKKEKYYPYTYDREISDPRIITKEIFNLLYKKFDKYEQTGINTFTDDEMDKFIIMYDDKTCSCVDNTSGHLYIEDFNDIILGIRYLQGESIDKLRDEECKYEILIYETKEDYEQGEPFQHNVYSDLKSAKKELMDIVKFNNYYSGKVMDQKTDEELFSFETLESEEDEEIIQ